MAWLRTGDAEGRPQIGDDNVHRQDGGADLRDASSAREMQKRTKAKPNGSLASHAQRRQKGALMAQCLLSEAKSSPEVPKRLGDAEGSPKPRILPRRR